MLGFFLFFWNAFIQLFTELIGVLKTLTSHSYFLLVINRRNLSVFVWPLHKLHLANELLLCNQVRESAQDSVNALIQFQPALLITP